eukprot:SAG31_NODE_1333_length_8743_cov_1.681050_13_plen_56_part_00
MIIIFTWGSSVFQGPALVSTHQTPTDVGILTGSKSIVDRLAAAGAPLAGILTLIP